MKLIKDYVRTKLETKGIEIFGSHDILCIGWANSERYIIDTISFTQDSLRCCFITKKDQPILCEYYTLYFGDPTFVQKLDFLLDNIESIMIFYLLTNHDK